MSIATDHQARIAAKTLTMPGAMVGVMGGPSKKEAVRTLIRLGYSRSDIEKFLRSKKYSAKEIARLLGEEDTVDFKTTYLSDMPDWEMDARFEEAMGAESVGEDVMGVPMGLLNECACDLERSARLREKDDTDYSDSFTPGRKSPEERLLRGRGGRGKAMAMVREGTRLLGALKKKVGQQEGLAIYKKLKKQARNEADLHGLLKDAIKNAGR